MSIVTDYPTASEARAHLKDVLDSNARGITVTVRRDDLVSAVVPADRLRDHLTHAVPARVSLLSEGGGVVAIMEGRPFVSEGATVEEALGDLILSLREYAEDWDDHLRNAPNHAGNWALVQLVKLSTDEELIDWFKQDRG